MLQSIIVYAVALIASIAIVHRLPFQAPPYPFTARGATVTPRDLKFLGLALILLATYSTWVLFKGAHAGEIESMLVRHTRAPVSQVHAGARFFTEIFLRAAITPLFLVLGGRLYLLGHRAKVRP